MANRVHDRVSAIAQRLFAAAPAPAAPRTILVIDDEEGIRRFVERVLQSAGYTVVVAASGPEALHTAEGIEGLDLVVTDVMMPEMSGCELARRLRQQNPDIKVLYVTGYADRLFDEKVAMWENEAFVEKPCSVKSLLEGVSLLWSQHIDTTLAPQPAN